MFRQRLVFSKTGRASYISHLDLMRVFQRAFFRAGKSAWHTEGFNPHLYISIAQPLPVGMEGSRELLDFESPQEDASDVVSALNGVLPQGVRVLSCYPAQRPTKQIAFAQYSVTWMFDDRAPDPETLLARLESAPVTVMKKTKSGDALTDISPLIKSLILVSAGEKEMTLRGVLAAGGQILNPVYLTAAAIPEGTRVHTTYLREGFLDEAGKVFD